MKRISRRAVLKGGLAMPVVAAVGLPERYDVAGRTFTGTHGGLCHEPGGTV